MKSHWNAPTMKHSDFLEDSNYINAILLLIKNSIVNMWHRAFIHASHKTITACDRFIPDKHSDGWTAFPGTTTRFTESCAFYIDFL